MWPEIKEIDLLPPNIDFDCASANLVIRMEEDVCADDLVATHRFQGDSIGGYMDTTIHYGESQQDSACDGRACSWDASLPALTLINNIRTKFLASPNRSSSQPRTSSGIHGCNTKGWDVLWAFARSQRGLH